MPYRSSTGEEFNMKQNTSRLQEQWKSLPNGAGSSQSYKEVKPAQEGSISPTWSSLSGDEFRVSVGTETLHRREAVGSISPTWSSLSGDELRVSVGTEALHGAAEASEYREAVTPPKTQSTPNEGGYRVHGPTERDDFTHEAPNDDPLAVRIERHLVERRGAVRQRGGRSCSICIFRFPQNLVGIEPCEYQPEIASIGPYHRGRNHVLDFEEHKWSFLEKFLYRQRFSVSYLLGKFRQLEETARDCYSDGVLLSSHDFIEMMVLDGCFIIEFLRHLNHCGDMIHEDDPIFTRPWLIPIIMRDLLKLENQLPYFVIDSLFEWSGGNTDIKESADPLPLLSLKAFDLAFSRPLQTLTRFNSWKGDHLLDLFHASLLPSSQIIITSNLQEYHPSDQPIQCVTQLRTAGLKFKSRKADNFLDINFRNRTLQIPPITINDFTSTILINCVALEQCKQKRPKYLTDYVCFMSCLINQPRDVAFLCSDGVITRFSKDDQYVANLVNNLGKNAAFNIRDCHLSKQFREVESYYSSYWATMRRTYFSSPWSFISVLSAFVLLVLTLVQSIMSILSYKCQ